MSSGFYREAPPQGNPPPYAFVSRVYRKSLRPVVIATGLISALWCLLWGIAAFKDISVDNGQGQAPRLVVFDIVLGVLYIATAAIEAFGVGAAYLQRIALVRIYAFVALVATLLVIAAGFIRVIVHFIFKSTLINECTKLVTGETVVTRFGLWGDFSETQLTADQAAKYCNNAWSRDSFSEIAWLLVAIVVGLLFSSIAFSYYRQLLDPTSPANATRAASNRYQGGTFTLNQGRVPDHYQPPYNAPDLPYNSSSAQRGIVPEGTFAPPPGKPPGYSPSAEGYGTGISDSKNAYGASKGQDDDPFADFDAARARDLEEHDVTSRPAPGGSDRFHV